MKNLFKLLSALILLTCVFFTQSCTEETIQSVTISDDGSPCPETPTITYAGKTYNTVLIGDDCWLKENLDIGTMIESTREQTNNGTIEKYCYDDDTANCDTYGGLYQWDEAMQYNTLQGEQGICPPGWHIPTLEEYQSLITRIKDDGNTLKAIGQGSGIGAGTNSTGFSALFGGYCYSDGEFKGIGTDVVFRSSTEYNSDRVYSLMLLDITPTIYLNHGLKTVGFCVRCVKD